MFVEQALKQYIGETPSVMLDLCAAPGGKSTHARSVLPAGSLLVANEVIRNRSQILAENLTKWGHPGVVVTNNDPADFADLEGFFDVILTDVPCSGEGMFRKDSAMVKAWEQNGPEFYAKLQREILEQALPMLKEGGMLLYSTCTFSPLEDEGSVQYLLSLDPSLKLVDMEGYSGFVKGNPAWIDSENKELEKCVRMFPHKLDGEGHFLALLQKGEKAAVKKVHFSQKRKGLKGEEKKLFEEFQTQMNRTFDSERLESKNGMIYYMPEKLPDMKGLRFLRSGLFMGEMKKKRFEPSQSLAMALKREDYKKRVEFSADDEEVFRYLKGETILLQPEQIVDEGKKPGGWYLVCVDGFPLGWGKAAGMTLKNKYHQGWRLL